MRILPALVLTFLLQMAPSAHAAIVEHHDLASLALLSDVIVRAERTGGADDAAQFRVLARLGGAGLDAGDTFTVSLGSYILDPGPATGIPLPGPVEPTAILFLVRARSTFEPPWHVESSGLRIVSAGRAYRFEGWNGGFAPVAQGPDPLDVWGENYAVQLTLSELEDAIACAVARVARARIAIAAHDRNAILALMPPPVEPLAQTHLGFFHDYLADQAFHALASAGDTDGALDVYARIRGVRPWRHDIDTAALVSRIENMSAPIHVRIAAAFLLASLRIPDVRTVHRLDQLVRDVSTPRDVRCALVYLFILYGGLPIGIGDSQARRDALRASVLRLIADRVDSDPDDWVRVALVECATNWDLRRVVPPSRAVVSAATVRMGTVYMHVAIRPDSSNRLRTAHLVAADGTLCSNEVQSDRSGRGAWAWRFNSSGCIGANRVRAELVDGTTFEIPIAQ